MLPKKFRLSAGDYYHHQNTSQKLITPQLLLFYKKETDGNSRFAIIVPKALEKRAVYRNRTKRMVSQAIFNYLTKLKHGFLVLIKARRIFKKEDKARVEKEITEALLKVGIL